MSRLIRIIISIAAVAVGIIFVISGIHTLATKDLYDSTVEATVVDVQEEWVDSGEDSHTETRVYIDYEIDGKKYEHIESPVSDSGMKIGDKVEILYQSKDPSQISGKNITAGGVIFIVVGVIVALGGCIATIRALVRR